MCFGHSVRVLTKNRFSRTDFVFDDRLAWICFVLSYYFWFFIFLFIPLVLQKCFARPDGWGAGESATLLAMTSGHTFCNSTCPPVCLFFIFSFLDLLRSRRSQGFIFLSSSFFSLQMPSSTSQSKSHSANWGGKRKKNHLFPAPAFAWEKIRDFFAEVRGDCYVCPLCPSDGWSFCRFSYLLRDRFVLGGRLVWFIRLVCLLIRFIYCLVGLDISLGLRFLIFKYVTSLLNTLW